MAINIFRVCQLRFKLRLLTDMLHSQPANFWCALSQMVAVYKILANNLLIAKCKAFPMVYSVCPVKELKKNLLCSSAGWL